MLAIDWTGSAQKKLLGLKFWLVNEDKWGTIHSYGHKKFLLDLIKIKWWKVFKKTQVLSKFIGSINNNRIL